MNSFYGVLGTSASRFFSPTIAGGITAWGRELLLWSKARIEYWGFRVLYGGTDNLFILSAARTTPRPRYEAASWWRASTKSCANASTRPGRSSKLELEYEKLYTRLLLLATRGRTGGGRRAQEVRRPRRLQEKRQGRADRARSGPEDWTDLAKEVQRELYDRLFRERDVQEYLRQVVKSLRSAPSTTSWSTARRSGRASQVHRHHPAPRRRREKTKRQTRPADHLRDDHRRSRAPGRKAPPPRPRALRAEADPPDRRAGPGGARPRFRHGRRRRGPAEACFRSGGGSVVPGMVATADGRNPPGYLLAPLRGADPMRGPSFR